MNFKTIVTLGPAILQEDKLKRIDECGQCIYRINGAHSSVTETQKLINEIRKILPNAKIMIDLPGSKVRTANLFEPIRLVKGEPFLLYDHQVNYPDFYRYLKVGDIIRASDSLFTLEVAEILGSTIKILSHSDGLLYSNKGLHIRGIYRNMPFLLERDFKLLEIARSFRIEYLSLSFVRTKEDIRQVKNVLGRDDIHIIAKIETKMALDNLEDILKEVESILIDRGDLSTEIEMLELSSVQDEVVKKALSSRKDVYLATQFLKNMETKPVPLISEVMDLCKSVNLGVKGIQLSEETAIGKYPVECVKLVFTAFKNSLFKK